MNRVIQLIIVKIGRVKTTCAILNNIMNYNTIRCLNVSQNNEHSSCLLLIQEGQLQRQLHQEIPKDPKVPYKN